MLCALRGYAAEPGSLKRGCFTQFRFQMTFGQLLRTMGSDVKLLACERPAVC